MTRRNLTRFTWLSIAAALATIALKTYAYYLTGSVDRADCCCQAA